MISGTIASLSTRIGGRCPMSEVEGDAESRDGEGLVATFVFLCPVTGLNVQAYTAEDIGADDVLELELCIACAHSHIINLKTGRVVVADV